MLRHIIFKRKYSPPLQANRMKNLGDLKAAREDYYKNRPGNLTYLLKQRYTWMNEYIDGKETVIEIGSGAGIGEEFIHNKNLKLTDVQKYDWIDLEVDALNPPFEDGTIDAIIASNMIHHLARPVVFFQQMARILKPSGLLVIHEVNNSVLMRFLLWLMRHEGWSYDEDVFDIKTVSNDPDDPWSANCAVPQILFKNPAKFESHFKEFKVLRNELCEGFIFPLSGGVTAKTKIIQLPYFLLELVGWLDRILISLVPRVFALGRRVVLQRLPVPVEQNKTQELVGEGKGITAPN